MEQHRVGPNLGNGVKTPFLEQNVLKSGPQTQNQSVVVGLATKSYLIFF